MRNYFRRVQSSTPTKFWINNVTRAEAEYALEAGAVGCTQNPAYVWKLISNTNELAYVTGLLDEILKDESDDGAAVVKLQLALVADIAKKFMPLYKSSCGRQGYVSIQGDPFREDAQSILEFARFHREAGPNIMAKIPVTEDGLKAIEVLAAEGMPINATECMAVRQVLDVCDVYVRAAKNMSHPAPLYFSLITGIYDEYLQKHVEQRHIDIDRDALWQAGMSIAKKVHALVKERNYPCGFIGGGARGLHHFTEMVGADASITINWKGAADALIAQNPPVVSRFLQPTPFSVEDVLIEKLEDYRKAYFIHGIEPHEYEHFGPVVLFRTNFEDAWKSTVQFVADYRRRR